MSNEPYYTLAEVMALLHCSKQWVVYLTSQGKLTRIAHSVYSKSSVDAYLAEKKGKEKALK
jgi:hypothetical protein